MEEDNSITMVDVLKDQEAFEEDAKAVLGGSDDKNCTYTLGYVKRQALYACLTCCPDSISNPECRSGICLACSLACHENHNLVELYTKRNFRCDCAGPKLPNTCSFNAKSSELNNQNEYNQNFSGLYCTCHKPYPDPDDTVEDEMIQCIICEDWFHSRHLNATLPPTDHYSEMICEVCTEKNNFLQNYLCYEANSQTHVQKTNEADDVNIEKSSNESCVDTDTSFGQIRENSDQQNCANNPEALVTESETETFDNNCVIKSAASIAQLDTPDIDNKPNDNNCVIKSAASIAQLDTPDIDNKPNDNNCVIKSAASIAQLDTPDIDNKPNDNNCVIKSAASIAQLDTPDIDNKPNDNNCVIKSAASIAQLDTPDIDNKPNDNNCVIKSAASIAQLDTPDIDNKPNDNNCVIKSAASIALDTPDIDTKSSESENKEQELFQEKHSNIGNNGDHNQHNTNDSESTELNSHDTADLLPQQTTDLLSPANVSGAADNHKMNNENTINDAVLVVDNETKSMESTTQGLSVNNSVPEVGCLDSGVPSIQNAEDNVSSTNLNLAANVDTLENADKPIECENIANEPTASEIDKTNQENTECGAAIDVDEQNKREEQKMTDLINEISPECIDGENDIPHELPPKEPCTDTLPDTNFVVSDVPIVNTLQPCANDVNKDLFNIEEPSNVGEIENMDVDHNSEISATSVNVLKEKVECLPVSSSDVNNELNQLIEENLTEMLDDMDKTETLVNINNEADVNIEKQSDNLTDYKIAEGSDTPLTNAEDCPREVNADEAIKSLPDVSAQKESETSECVEEQNVDASQKEVNSVNHESEEMLNVNDSTIINDTSVVSQVTPAIYNKPNEGESEIDNSVNSENQGNIKISSDLDTEVKNGVDTNGDQSNNDTYLQGCNSIKESQNDLNGDAMDTEQNISNSRGISATKRKPDNEHSPHLASPLKKKIKQEIVYISECIKPMQSIHRKRKGATFWPSDWRSKLCTCKSCVDVYNERNVGFILDLEDTVSAYEDLGKIKTESTPSQYEKGMEALSTLGHVQQINAITEYNKMKEKLLEFLKTFKDKKEVVKEEDIKGFFAGMKPKREPDGVYFCR